MSSMATIGSSIPSTVGTPDSSINGENEVYTTLYGLDLFVDQISEEFKCPICLCVLKEAQVLNTCQHMYCKICITTYFQSFPQSNFCPLDKSPATMANVLPAPRAINNVIEMFRVKCRNYEDGCTARFPLKELDKHGELCHFRPCTTVPNQTSSVSNIAMEVRALPMTLYVRIADTSKTVIITATEEDNVLTLKRRIQEKEGINADALILVNGTKPLADDRRLLIEYDIKNGSTIFSTRRCIGGYV